MARYRYTPGKGVTKISSDSSSSSSSSNGGISYVGGMSRVEGGSGAGSPAQPATSSRRQSTIQPAGPTSSVNNGRTEEPLISRLDEKPEPKTVVQVPPSSTSSITIEQNVREKTKEKINIYMLVLLVFSIGVIGLALQHDAYNYAFTPPNSDFEWKQEPETGSYYYIAKQGFKVYEGITPEIIEGAKQGTDELRDKGAIP